MNSDQQAFLRDQAKKYIWWKTPEEALEHPQRVLAQVMNIGLWDDLCQLVTVFTSEELIEVLNKAEIGQFNGRSWSFWNYRLKGVIPPMPKRILQ